MPSELTKISGSLLEGGSINNIPIGDTTPNTGAFTTLEVNSIDITPETGTFTPTFYGSSVAGSPTGTFAGRYIKIGKFVFASIRAVFTDLGGLTGQLRMDGLPFNVRNDFASRAGISVAFRNNFTVDFVIGGYAVQNTNDIYFFDMEQDVHSLIETDMSNTSEIYFTLTYEAA